MIRTTICQLPNDTGFHWGARWPTASICQPWRSFRNRFDGWTDGSIPLQGTITYPIPAGTFWVDDFFELSRNCWEMFSRSLQGYTVLYLILYWGEFVHQQKTHPEIGVISLGSTWCLATAICGCLLAKGSAHGNDDGSDTPNWNTPPSNLYQQAYLSRKNPFIVG